MSKKQRSGLTTRSHLGLRTAKKNYPFGDYIVWRQLLDQCKSEAKPAFFVTSDVKEDWWQESMGAKLGALPRLREEFQRETGQEFHLYETTHFIEVFAPKFKVEHQEAVKEIHRIQQKSRISRAIETELHARIEDLRHAEIRRETEQIIDENSRSQTY